MVRTPWRRFASLAVVGIVVIGGAAMVPVQQAGGLPALEQAVEALAQRVVRGAEPQLIIVRGTVSPGDVDANIGPFALAGAGFSVSNPLTVYCGSNAFPTYLVTFDRAFASPPSVVVSAHGQVGSPVNYPVYTVAIDHVTEGGFFATIATDAFGSSCAPGSANWDFIAIGPR